MATQLRRAITQHTHPSATVRIGPCAPHWVRLTLALAGSALLLFLLQYVCFVATRIPVALSIAGQDARFQVDGSTLDVKLPSAPTSVLFVPGSPLMREYQLDGTDDANNFTEDPTYVARVADEPYIRFENWMRDASSYSSWRGITMRSSGSGATPEGLNIALPAGTSVTISASVMRLEAPAATVIYCGPVPCGMLTINRNDRSLQVATLLPDGTEVGQAQVFFPVGPLPFIAEVTYLLAHVALWALALLAALVSLQLALAFVFERLRDRAAQFTLEGDVPAGEAGGQAGADRWRLRARDGDRLALVTCALSLLFTCYIALAEYHAQPHILDASAFVMQAKIFASGQLSVPAPTNLAEFQGPFMVAFGGRWFSQYAPGTSLLLALGYLAHLPWLVEPLLGTLALWGMYRLGRLWFGRATAWLAVLLAALSPFYSYLAASYLSHTPALCFEVYMLLGLTRYARTLRRRELVFAAACWSALLLTREMSAVLLGLAGITTVGVCRWHRLWTARAQVLRDALAASVVAFAGCGAYLLYDVAQTGAALVTPRALFSPADRIGFGTGIGFYGQHTLAAGVVNLDALLTSLSIDLYGWPFYLTLVFLPLALVGRRARRRWDLCCLATIALLALAQVAYFYHGIYLGPRYLFDTLPFLALLTARGITNVPRVLVRCCRYAVPHLEALVRARGRQIAGALAAVSVCALMLCNLCYYLPRQISLYANYSGLPASQPVDVGAIYALHPPNAIILTHDWYIYNYVTWPLNDPSLSGPTLYAYAETGDDIAALRREFPGRHFYALSIASSGAVRLEPVQP